ncbi:MULTISPECIES: hypothetical protein [unclassified Acinetobacter]|uniref:hypothetical protein n=1 Tax=unclassified Acinetobacter TaxID=196816 RepID=UPI0015D3DE0F|nr:MULTISPECIES: hypothetical protein [unclassified Acinetobacter]
MKMQSYFKYFCFGFSAFSLFQIYSDIVDGKTEISAYLGNIGLFLVCIEMGVLMTYEQLTAEVTLRNFFSKDKSLSLSPVGIFAHTLGKIGCILLIIDFVISFA